MRGDVAGAQLRTYLFEHLDHVQPQLLEQHNHYRNRLDMCSVMTVLCLALAAVNALLLPNLLPVSYAWWACGALLVLSYLSYRGAIAAALDYGPVLVAINKERRRSIGQLTWSITLPQCLPALGATVCVLHTTHSNVCCSSSPSPGIAYSTMNRVWPLAINASTRPAQQHRGSGPPTRTRWPAGRLSSRGPRRWREVGHASASPRVSCGSRERACGRARFGSGAEHACVLPPRGSLTVRPTVGLL